MKAFVKVPINIDTYNHKKCGGNLCGREYEPTKTHDWFIDRWYCPVFGVYMDDEFRCQECLDGEIKDD